MAVATGLRELAQDSFAAGSFPDIEVVPADGAEDIVNGVIDEDASVFRRGGSSYVGTFVANPSANRPFRNLWSGYLGAVGQATVASRMEGTPIYSERFWTMIGAETDFTFGWAGSVGAQRPVVFNGMLVFSTPIGAFQPGVTLQVWGGARQTDNLAENVSFTAGSKTVTGTGTSWSGSIVPGMMLQDTALAGDRVAVVESVQSNTSLTLLSAYPVTESGLRDIVSTAFLNVAATQMPANPSAKTYLAVAESRLVIARGNRVTFTGGDDPFVVVEPDDYHDLPYGAQIVGMEPLRDQLLVFTTAGVFVILGLAFNLTDAAGNDQQRVEQVAPDVVLWDNRGVAAWRGSIVAPCTDDVYLIDSASSMRPILGGMRKLYREYVAAGYQLGVASVYKSHYILPVLSNQDTLIPANVDTLVCDLRTGAWTRWDGFGADVSALTLRIGDASRSPQLYALGLAGSSPRVLELTSTLEAGGGNDADGSTPQLQVTTRRFTVSALARLWRKFRARLNGTWSLEVASNGSFSSVSGPVSTADDASTWVFGERARAVRFRLSSSSSSARLKTVEAMYRDSGRTL